MRLKKKTRKGKEKVYDIEVKDNHNFIANGVVVHNCHHVPSKTFSEVASQFMSKHMLGITGTYERADRLEILANMFIGRIAYYNTDADLNHVETANIFRLDTGTNFYVPSGQHAHKLYHQLLSNRERFLLFLELYNIAKGKGRKQLIFSHSTTYTKLYNALLNEMGHSSGLMIGGDNERNMHTKKLMLEGKLDSICCTYQFMQEGESINNIDLIHFLTPIANNIQFTQATARGQRQHQDKQKLIVLDYVDQIRRCMRAWENRVEWSSKNNSHNYYKRPLTLKDFDKLR